MGTFLKRILFDQQDYDLLRIVNDVLEGGKERRHLKNIIGQYSHPHGIVEMAAPKVLRMAYSIVHLIGSLDADEAGDRTTALRSLNHEVMSSGASSFRFNTARVLLQIMKELVRNAGNPMRQLELAHDFRASAHGKQRFVRKQLRKYHLLEMPEDWSQVSFDDHVHDANTKGRKSPTHLIMDAWIKGIRYLTVVYYNYVQPEAAAELMEAAHIMEIRVRIGVEFSARFQNRYIHLIWGMRGLTSAQDYLSFLAKKRVIEFMNKSRKVSYYQQRYVFQILKEFNEKHRIMINHEFKIELPPIEKDGFLQSVGSGQPSLLHLAKHIHTCLVPAMRKGVEKLIHDHASAPSAEKYAGYSSLIDTMNRIDPDTVYDRYLAPANNPSIINPNEYLETGPQVPSMLMLSANELIDELKQVRHGSSITLNLKNLNVEDVLEILYDCRGHVTHLEIFNLKDYASGGGLNYEKINELQLALNSGNVILLKRLILTLIDRLSHEGQTKRATRIIDILQNISLLMNFYRETPLRSCAGTDSTGHSKRYPGMGIVLEAALPPKARKELKKKHVLCYPIPIKMDVCFRVTGSPMRQINPFMTMVMKLIRHLPFAVFIGQKRVKEWVVQSDSIRIEQPGNILSIGGIGTFEDNGLHLEHHDKQHKEARFSLGYLNGGVKNSLKILAGFIPAFLTFALTKEWWVLAYLGAFIWFGITGMRNILQSVLGGGGFRRSPLVRWKDYVSWERFSDSLFYTGFSVPLLDYLVKTVFLDKGFNITTTTSPLLLYSIMALVNGVYISSHNLFRGLSKGAVFGNFFRSVLSIPVAILFNAAIGALLGAVGVTGINEILQKWAAVISKAASDSIAGIIEGVADRYENIRLRQIDYDKKLSQVWNSYTRLELLFPETAAVTFFESHKEFESISEPTGKIDKILIINALDLLYFRMYQPRARDVFKQLLGSMSEDERQVLTRCLSVLKYQKKISLMFVDGIIGKNFSKGLSFYLTRSEGYLKEIETMVARVQKLR